MFRQDLVIPCKCVQFLVTFAHRCNDPRHSHPCKPPAKPVILKKHPSIEHPVHYDLVHQHDYANTLWRECGCLRQSAATRTRLAAQTFSICHTSGEVTTYCAI